MTEIRDMANRHDNEPLSANALARGTAYAMEQAWCLLRDSVLLIQQTRYASGVVLATFSLEQLGRAEIYRANAKLASAGRPVSPRSMGKALTDHLAKLNSAKIPVTATATTFGEPPPIGSQAAIELGKRLEAVRKALEKEAPLLALDVRKRALHVDRIREQPGWNRASDVITKADADYWAGAAVVRYDLLRRDLERDATEIGKRIWAGIQHLPEPTWDVWTWEEEPNP